MALTMYRRWDMLSPNPLPLSDKINAARDSLKHLLAAYGCVPASVLGGNIDAYMKNDHGAPYPGGSDTGAGHRRTRHGGSYTS